MTWWSSPRLWEGPPLAGSPALWGDLETEEALHRLTPLPGQPRLPPPTVSPEKRIHRVESDCNCSHCPHTVPKCQGDSLLGEWLPAPSAVSWLLWPPGWERPH